MFNYDSLNRPNIDVYIEMLLNDFNVNQERAQAFSLVFLNGYPIEKLIKHDKEISGFHSWKNKGSIQYDSLINGIETIEKENLDFSFLKTFSDSDKDLYSFFKKKEFTSEIEANAAFNSGYYYIDINSFEEKMDNLFLSMFPEYHLNQQTNFYEKKINQNISFVFTKDKVQEYCLSITDYTFPEFYLKAEGELIHILSRTDVNSLLFIPAYSFLQFYSYFTKYTRNELGKIVIVKILDDEPRIFHDNFTNKYIVTNTSEKIKHFNLFIYLSLDLTIHYMKIFEKWLTTVIKQSTI